jgi:hypothetical protein
MSNQWVVPYNPYLLLKYNCHINVEICSSVKSVQYIYKYVYKGYDSTNVEFNVNYKGEVSYDEITRFQNLRYISAPEAAWRIFEYPLTEKSHAIYRLAVHVENGQNIVYEPGKESEAIESRKETTLTAWFNLNKNDLNAHKYFYLEIPNYYIFKNSKWVKRKIEECDSSVIGRMYLANPLEGERFYLRMLLLHVKGATSFADLKTVGGKVLNTFKDACKEKFIKGRC